METPAGLPRLLVIGDSISLGYGPYLEAMLADRVRCVRVGPGPSLVGLGDPSALNGGDSANVLTLIAQAKTAGTRPEWVLVNCGLHDIKTDPATGERQVPLEQYRANLAEIVARLLPAGRLIWVRSTPVDDARHNTSDLEFCRYNADVETYNAAADEIMTKNRVPMVDLYRFTQNLGADVYCDHVHFTEPVRQMQAAHIAGHLACLRASALTCLDGTG